jgi:hypothetical protein
MRQERINRRVEATYRVLFKTPNKRTSGGPVTAKARLRHVKELKTAVKSSRQKK